MLLAALLACSCGTRPTKARPQVLDLDSLAGVQTWDELQVRLARFDGKTIQVRGCPRIIKHLLEPAEGYALWPCAHWYWFRSADPSPQLPDPGQILVVRLRHPGPAELPEEPVVVTGRLVLGEVSEGGLLYAFAQLLDATAKTCK